MKWTLEYVIQSGAFLLLWLLMGATFGRVLMARRGR